MDGGRAPDKKRAACLLLYVNSHVRLARPSAGSLACVAWPAGFGLLTSKQSTKENRCEIFSIFAVGARASGNHEKDDNCQLCSKAAEFRRCRQFILIGRRRRRRSSLDVRQHWPAGQLGPSARLSVVLAQWPRNEYEMS
jgi:hypothetical protein